MARIRASRLADVSGTVFEDSDRDGFHDMTKPDDATSFGPPAARVFRATVHGIAFAGRARHLDGLERDAELLVLAAPPGASPDEVWVHLESGDPLGHLPPEIAEWLAPWLRSGGAARAKVLKVGDRSVPTWKRLLVEVRCSG